MKSLFTKTIATASLISMLSTSVFANQTLSKIIADAQNGVKTEIVISSLSSAVANGKVTPNDIREYLEENNSVKDYANFNAALESGNFSNVAEAIAQSGGAEYASSACYKIGQTAVVTGGIALAAVLAATLFLEGSNEYEREEPKRLQKSIDYYQVQLDAFRAAGLPDTNYVVRDHILAMESLKKDYNEAVDQLKKNEENTVKRKKITKAGLITAGASATVVIATGMICNK